MNLETIHPSTNELIPSSTDMLARHSRHRSNIRSLYMHYIDIMEADTWVIIVYGQSGRYLLDACY